MLKKEFLTFFITMIIGGLAYSIVSFSYMHQTFTTKESIEVQGGRIDRQDRRIDRNEERVKAALIRIETKLDRIIERGR